MHGFPKAVALLTAKHSGRKTLVNPEREIRQVADVGSQLLREKVLKQLGFLDRLTGSDEIVGGDLPNKTQPIADAPSLLMRNTRRCPCEKFCPFAGDSRS